MAVEEDVERCRPTEVMLQHKISHRTIPSELEMWRMHFPGLGGPRVAELLTAHLSIFTSSEPGVSLTTLMMTPSQAGNDSNHPLVTVWRAGTTLTLPNEMNSSDYSSQALVLVSLQFDSVDAEMSLSYQVWSWKANKYGTQYKEGWKMTYWMLTPLHIVRLNSSQ